MCAPRRAVRALYSRKRTHEVPAYTPGETKAVAANGPDQAYSPSEEASVKWSTLLEESDALYQTDDGDQFEPA